VRLICLSALLHVSGATAEPTNQIEAIQELSQTALGSGSLPFSDVVLATTGRRILLLNTNNPSHAQLCARLRQAAELTVIETTKDPIQAARPNEAGTQIERRVKAALSEAGLKARTPVNTSGRAQSTGYPDIEIPGNPHCYLELKTYSEAALTSSQRTFYYSPSEAPKVTCDALHLLLAFQLEKYVQDDQTLFKPSHWQLISLEDLQVRMKLEFNQSNRGLYGASAGSHLIGEGALQRDP